MPMLPKSDSTSLRTLANKRALDMAALGAVGANMGGVADAQERNYALELEDANARINEIESNRIPALEAELERLTDPNIDPKELQRLLQARGLDLGPKGIDGKIGPATTQARNQNIAKIEAEIAVQRSELESQRLLQADIRRNMTYSETAAGPLQGWARKGLEGAGLIGGLYLGKRLRGGAVNKSRIAAKALEDKVNRLINTNPITSAKTGPNSLNQRAANINDFYRHGGAENAYPFTTKQRTGEWTTRPKPADISSLYPAPKAFNAKDGLVVGAGGADAIAFEAMRHNEEKKIARLEEEIARLRSDPNADAELRRALEEKKKAETAMAVYTFLSRAGGGVAAGRLLGARTQPYARPRPNIADAEAEQALIRQHISKK